MSDEEISPFLIEFSIIPIISFIPSSASSAIFSICAPTLTFLSIFSDFSEILLISILLELKTFNFSEISFLNIFINKYLVFS